MLISLGSAPMGDSQFRTAVFFESNGGQGQNRQLATVPELRLAVAGPTIDIGNVETALESLTDRCYYLTLERNSCDFSMRENLNKRYSDRRAGIKEESVVRLVREQVEKVFTGAEGLERVFFPEKSGQIPNRPVITLVVGQPEKSLRDTPELAAELTAMIRESGSSMRTFKSALIWVVPDNADVMRDEARKLLAWEAIPDGGLGDRQTDDIRAALRGLGLNDNVDESTRSRKSGQM